MRLGCWKVWGAGKVDGDRLVEESWGSLCVGAADWNDGLEVNGLWRYIFDTADFSFDLLLHTTLREQELLLGMNRFYGNL